MKALWTFLAVASIACCAVAGANHWTSSGPAVASVSRVFVSANDPNTAFVSTLVGIFKTTNGGNNWTQMTGLPNQGANAFTVAADGKIYAAIRDTIYESDDNGEHWARRGSVGNFSVNPLMFDGSSKHLIAGLDGGSISVSTDGGATWKEAVIKAATSKVQGVNSLVVSRGAQIGRASGRERL